MIVPGATPAPDTVLPTVRRVAPDEEEEEEEEEERVSVVPLILPTPYPVVEAPEPVSTCEAVF